MCLFENRLSWEQFVVFKVAYTIKQLSLLDGNKSINGETHCFILFSW